MTFLLAATVLAYLPQYFRILTLRSSHGTSLHLSLLLALTAQTQLVTMYYAFVEYRNSSVIASPPDTQNWPDLIQIVVRWACSLLQYVEFIKSQALWCTDTAMPDLLSWPPSAPGRRADLIPCTRRCLGQRPPLSLP